MIARCRMHSLRRDDGIEKRSTAEKRDGSHLAFYHQTFPDVPFNSAHIGTLYFSLSLYGFLIYLWKLLFLPEKVSNTSLHLPDIKKPVYFGRK